MKFSVLNTTLQSIGTIDVTNEVYVDDNALLEVLANAGHIDQDDVYEVVEDVDGRVDIFEFETQRHAVSLTIIQ